MSQELDQRKDKLTPLQKAFLKVKEQERRINELEEQLAKGPYGQVKDIAIVGMAMQLPGAKNAQDYWQLISQKQDMVRPLPKGRQADLEMYYDTVGQPRPPFQQLAYLEEIDKFDYSFFRLTPKEAELINPIQRLFLQNAWQCMEDAGYIGEKVAGQNVGIYLGYSGDFTASQYLQMIQGRDKNINPIALPGNVSSIIPSRIAYLLDLRGPAIVLDTACSSSLVAVHSACMALLNGDCDMALAGGAKISIMPVQGQYNVGFESPNNRTRTFDKNADGTAIGEGVASLLLKPLDKALADRDQIYAVIKGSAINQDGTSAGITAPNVASQRDLLIEAWQRARISPETITLIEAHGTGTPIGDPIEADALRQAYAQYTQQKNFCAVGSVKTNIGHLFEAAGIAGLIKTVLALQHKQLPPSNHFEAPNPEINFAESPLYVNTELKDWPATGHPRRAGVSSFGISGTNSHVVLEEAPVYKADKRGAPAPWYLFTLSASTETRLLTYLQDMYEYLKANPQLALRDVCYTLNTARKHEKQRVAFVANSMESLIGTLQQWLEPGAGAYENNVYHTPDEQELDDQALEERIDELVDKVSAEVQALVEDPEAEISLKSLWQQVAALYVHNAHVDLANLFMDTEAIKVHLPNSPFMATRCWIDYKTASQTAAPAPTPIAAANTPQEAPNGQEPTQPDEQTVGPMLDTIVEQTTGFKPGAYDPQEDFLELGVDSLILFQIIERIKAQMGLELTIGDFYGRTGSYNKLLAYLLTQPLQLAPATPASTQQSTNTPMPENLMAWGQEITQRLDSIARHVGAPVPTNTQSMLPAQQLDPAQAAARREELGKQLARQLSIHGVGGDQLSSQIAASLEALEQKGWQFVSNQQSPAATLYPLCEEQQKMYSLTASSKEASSAYNEALMVELTGTLDAQLLESALQEVMQRHEALRTVYVNEKQQKTLEEVPLPFEVQNMTSEQTGLSGQAHQDAIEEWVKTAIFTPFDLEQGPLLRIRLVQKAPNHYALLVVAHHLIIDGWSLVVFWNETAALYTALKTGKAAQLPTPTPYRQFIDWQQDQFEQHATGPSVDFWVKEFSQKFKPLALPSHISNPKAAGYQGNVIRVEIAPDLLEQLNAFAKTQASTLFNILLAGYNVLLYRLSQQNEFVVGVPSSGQFQMGKSCLMGQCITMTPLYNSIDGQTLFKDYLGTLRNNFNQVLQHQNVSFDRIFEKEKQVSSPQILAAININNIKGNPDFEGLDSNLVPTPVGYVKYHLFLSFMQVQGSLFADFFYKTQLFEQATIEHWAQSYLSLLQDLIQTPEKPINQLNMVTPTQDGQTPVDDDWDNW